MIEIYETETGWRWRIKGNNGEIMATGEEYKTKFNVHRALGTLEYILTHDYDPVEIPLKHNYLPPLKHDMEYADEQRGLEIRSPHGDRGVL